MSQESAASTKGCANCGVEVPFATRFCGACGYSFSELEIPSMPLDAMPSVDSTATRGEGEIDLGFPFPIKVWRGLDPESSDAFEVYETNFAEQWAGRELMLHFGYFEIKGARRGLDQKAATGIDRAGKLFQNVVGYAYADRNRYRPNVARYFHRDSVLRFDSQGAEDRIRVLQLTYVRSFQLYRRDKDVTTYPPSPVSNLVLAILPKRVRGALACNLATQKFLARPGLLPNDTFVSMLNDQVVPVLQSLWAMDFDMFGGDRFNRGQGAGVFTRRWASIEDGTQSLEPVFSPTLFQTDVLNPEIWSGLPQRVRPSEERAREFAVGVMPCDSRTFVILQYPTSNIFDRHGALMKTHMCLDSVQWIVETLHRLLHEESSCEDWPATSSRDDDLSAYRTALDAPRRRGTGASGPGEAWLADQMGRWVTYKAANHPVLPLEIALRAAN
jgi:hypothetical protein